MFSFWNIQQGYHHFGLPFALVAPPLSTKSLGIRRICTAEASTGAERQRGRRSGSSTLSKSLKLSCLSERLMSPRRPISAIHIYDHRQRTSELISHQYPRDRVARFLTHFLLMLVDLAPGRVLFSTFLPAYVCPFWRRRSYPKRSQIERDIRFKPLSTDHVAGLALQR